MIMNFELGDAPLLPKQVFQGGRWKDRLAAKKITQKRSFQRSTNPSERELFKEKRHDVTTEDYIGPGAAPRPLKRQRVDHESGGNANKVAIGARKPEVTDNGGRSRSSFQEDKRSAFVAGKLPPGSINTGGKRAISFQEDTRPAFVAGKLPPGSINVGPKKNIVVPEETRPAFVSGKLPPGSINVGAKKTIKFNDDDPRPAFVPGKLPSGSVSSGKPNQIISSLFSFNPSSKTKFEEPEEEAEPAKPSNAPLTPEMATFTALGLSTRLAAHLSTKMDMKAPTAIQKAAITQMVKDDSDAFIQAETGSGKTLAYLLPIVERILGMSSKDTQVHRDSGLFAVVLAPTRELCKQIATVLEKILKIGRAHV